MRIGPVEADVHLPRQVGIDAAVDKQLCHLMTQLPRIDQLLGDQSAVGVSEDVTDIVMSSLFCGQLNILKTRSHLRQVLDFETLDLYIGPCRDVDDSMTVFISNVRNFPRLLCRHLTGRDTDSSHIPPGRIPLAVEITMPFHPL